MPYDDETLEAAAQMLERLGGNHIYQFAWRRGAQRIRALKSDVGCKVLNDSDKQIGTTAPDRCAHGSLPRNSGCRTSGEESEEGLCAEGISPAVNAGAQVGAK